MSGVDEAPTALTCPLGLFNFPAGSILLEDADEEILELYMDLASTDEDDVTGQGGLGFLDSSQAVLQLDLVLKAETTKAPIQLQGETQTSKHKRGRHGARAAVKMQQAQEIHVEVQVQQDLSALKGRKGDTGSVLWRSSLHLARHILSQHHFPPLTHLPLLNASQLSHLHILELGAGTGLLALLLARLCRTYTASDRLENLHLVARNLQLNSVRVEAQGATKDAIHAKGTGRNASKILPASDARLHSAVRLEEIDWLEVSKEREIARRRALQQMVPPTSGLARSSLQREPESRASPSHKGLPHKNENDDPDAFDLVLAVDCIYNENLIAPLVDTFAKYTRAGGETLVWVVVELRSSDVLTLFLETWLNHESGPWHIVRLGPGAMGQWDGHKPRWVGWVGWR